MSGSLPQEVTPAQLFDLSCQACGCNDPNCGLMLTAVCHPRAGTRVKFYKGTATLQVVCAKCDALVVRIKLGPVA